MIASLSDKLGFIKIPKNASSSVASWIHNNCDQIVGERMGHQALASITVPEGVKTFCFLRDPAERFVSACRWLLRGGSNSEIEGAFGGYLRGIGDESQIAEVLASNPKVSGYLHFIPQTFWISVNGKVAVDYLFLYQNDSDWMSGVLSGLIKRNATLPEINASASRSDASALTPNALKAIQEFYAEDYQLITRYKVSGTA